MSTCLKVCSKCGKEHPEINFYRKNLKRANGSVENVAVQPCKSCKKIEVAKWAKNNPDKIKAMSREAYKRWAAKPGNTAARWQRYYESHKPEETARKAAKRTLVQSATLGDRQAITAFYEHAQLMTKLTGIQYEVDHIDPLVSPLVCGLHTPANLRVITKKQNGAKSNNFTPYGFNIDFYLL